MYKSAGVPRSNVHPLQIAPNARELYYTMSVWYVEECRCTHITCNPPTTPAIWTSCYRALVHHVSLICGRIQTYPGQMYIPTLIKPSALTEPYYIMSVSHVVRSDVHPLLTNPNVTKPYYTMSVWHMEECRHTQVRCNPSGPPIIPNTTQLYYTISVWHVGECRDTQVRSPPPANPP